MKKTTEVPAPQGQTIVIPPVKTALFTLGIKGTTPLIVHKFSTKAKNMMLDKQTGKARQKKAPKVPEDDFRACLHVISEGKYGFPASGLKKAAVNACRYVEGINMTFAQGAFHVVGDLLEIQGSEPNMREDVVRLPGIRPVADIRYRAEFKKWRIEVPIRFNTAAITPEQLVNLFSVAGFAVGIGEWRPAKSGSFGMFEIETGGTK